MLIFFQLLTKYLLKEVNSMTPNEQELISIIREAEDPTEALVTAFFILCDWLRQHESSTGRSAVPQPESCEKPL